MENQLSVLEDDIVLAEMGPFIPRVIAVHIPSFGVEGRAVELIIESLSPIAVHGRLFSQPVREIIHGGIGDNGCDEKALGSGGAIGRDTQILHTVAFEI